MTNITVYDDTAKQLEKVADKMDTSIAEVIDALMDYIEEIQE
jgi:hypothetical protein